MVGVWVGVGVILLPTRQTAHKADGPSGPPAPASSARASRLVNAADPAAVAPVSKYSKPFLHLLACPIRWRASARLLSSSLVRWVSPGRSGAPCSSSKRRSGWRRRSRPPAQRGQKLGRNGLRARCLRRGQSGVRKSRPLRSVQEASGDWARRESQYEKKSQYVGVARCRQ